MCVRVRAGLLTLTPTVALFTHYSFLIKAKCREKSTPAISARCWLGFCVNAQFTPPQRGQVFPDAVRCVEHRVSLSLPRTGAQLGQLFPPHGRKGVRAAAPERLGTKTSSEIGCPRAKGTFLCQVLAMARALLGTRREAVRGCSAPEPWAHAPGLLPPFGENGTTRLSLRAFYPSPVGLRGAPTT